MDFSPTTHAFLELYREERKNWTVLKVQGWFVATDRNRKLGFDEPMPDEVVTIEFVTETCETREMANTFIALVCFQNALSKLGVL